MKLGSCEDIMHDRIGPMHIMISFCNVRMPARPILGLLNIDSSEFCILQPPSELPQCSGITGLAASERYVYAVVQTRPTSGLLIFDHSALTILNYYTFRLAVDVHSIWVSGELLYAVSTGTDEVIELEMRDAEVISEAVFWRPEPQAQRADIHHLNAVFRWRGDLLVSGFGKKREHRWNSARDGFIVNISKSEKLFSGIYHPHSLFVFGNNVAYCESSEMAVCLAGKTRISRQLAGYTRGLCIAGNKLFVGTSKGRKVSKSTGEMNNPTVSSVPTGRCAITRLSCDSLEIENSIDLDTYGTSVEIYDLLPLQANSSWRVVEDITFRPFDITQELAALIPPGDTFILVDEDQWGTDDVVAGRRRILFLERDGMYWGLPPDDDIAIRELERLRESGAKFIVFGWPTFWWFDYYRGLHSHLRSGYSCVLKNDHIVVFDLRAATGNQSKPRTFV